MENWLLAAIHSFLAIFALPQVGLPTIFVVSLVSATLLPMGSEPAVFAYVQINQSMFWPAVITATVGNTIGGVVSYYMGSGAQVLWHKMQSQNSPDKLKNDYQRGYWHGLSRKWFLRFGPPALLLSWLPGVGDPLCAVAGWLKLPFWQSVTYMAIGKFLRYVVLTYALLKAWPLIT